MTETLLQSWHDYFITVAQVSATLAGLLFVGITISLGHMLAVRGYLYRAWAALFLQFEALLIGLFALIPRQGPVWLGAEDIAASLAVFAAIRIFGHYFPDDENAYVLGSKGSRLVREILIHTAALLPLVAGAMLIAGSTRAFFWLIPPEVIGLYLSFGLAWAFAIEIPRRAAEDKAKR